MSSSYLNSQKVLSQNGIVDPNQIAKLRDRFSKMRLMNIKDYEHLHATPIVPLNIRIDIEEFENNIAQYQSYFRVWQSYPTWGSSDSDQPRYSIPLVNLTGNIDDDVDPTCQTLIKWWRDNPDKMYLDHDFTMPTQVLRSRAFDPLAPIKPFMIRSSVLLWHKNGHFKPHVDMMPGSITHLRLWGTNVDHTKYRLVVGNKLITNFEPGRLYLIDTVSVHEAHALSDNVYTFFIAVKLDALDIIRTLISS